MFKAADLPGMIPVFPLPGALLLPRTRLPLHIFEPRYLAMIDDALKSPHRLIGMIQPRGPAERLHSIGCAGRITAFTETDDRRYMITLGGTCRFRVTREVEGFAPYRRCDVDWADFGRDLGTAENDPGFRREPFLELLARYFQAQGLTTDWSNLQQAEDEMLINSLSMLCPFAPEDRQALLEARSLPIRRETLVTLVEFALRGGSDEEPKQ